MNEEQSGEDRLSEAMRAAVTGLGAGTVDLVAGGAARGRALRRRRRTWAVSGASMAAVAIVGVVLGVNGAIQGGGPQQAPLLAGSASSSASPADTAAAEKTKSASEKLPDGTQIFNALGEVVPSSYTLSLVQSRPGYVEAKASDAQGSVLLEVEIQPGAAKNPGLYPCPTHSTPGATATAPAGSTTQCENLSAPAGAHLITITKSYKALQGDIDYWFADYGRADGVRITINEVNSLDAANPQGPSRPQQAFSTTQLADMTRSSLWPAS